MVVSLSTADIHAEVIGSGKPLLMIHGNWCDHRLMKGCMEPVFTSGSRRKTGESWRRIYFDLPGMGETHLRKAVSSTDEILDLIVEFIENLIPEDVFYIASESYGSYLARGLVKKFPHRVGGIMMLCPVVVPEPEERDLPEREILFRENEFYDSLSENDRSTCDRMLTIQTKDNWRRYIDEVRCGVRKADITLLKKIKKGSYKFREDVDALEKPFDKPSLIITGRQDLATGYRDAFALIDKYTRSDFAILDSAGHMLQIEQAETFEALVSGWLARLEQ